MPKKKQFLQANKKKHIRKPETPQSADDYLEAGVDFEESGEKWRAGDAAKSARFFTRAIETYETGLQIFPQAFDLAYNRARIQYDITQQPRLLHELHVLSNDLLQVALESHRYALIIKPDNTDLLFNTAQVLRSIAEALTLGATVSPENSVEALNSLDEAIALFRRCLQLQEEQFSQAESQARMMAAASMPVDDQEQLVSPQSPMSDASGQEQWVSIEQPPDKDTLLDTSIALVEALTDLCALLPSQNNPWLPKIGELSKGLFEGGIAAYVEKQDRVLEFALTKANLLSSFADASFRAGNLDIHAYEDTLRTAFGDGLDIAHSPKGLCERAEAFQLLASTVCAQSLNEPSPGGSEVQWKYLTEALSDLKAASTLPGTKNLAKIHIRRGDCELLRYRLGQLAPYHKAAQTNAATLLRNAEVYYRGAFNSAQAENLQQGEGLEASMKEAVVIAHAGITEKLWNLFQKDMHEVSRLMEEMKDEVLISDELFDRLRTELTDALAATQR